jgi:hypothetical protein
MDAYLSLMELWGYEFMVSLDALIDSCRMLFSDMVYHWWMIMLFMVNLT